MDAAYCYKCRTWRGLQSVCVLGTGLSCAKTAEPIDMPLAGVGRPTRVGPIEPCIRWGR